MDARDVLHVIIKMAASMRSRERQTGRLFNQAFNNNNNNSNFRENNLNRKRGGSYRKPNNNQTRRNIVKIERNRREKNVEFSREQMVASEMLLQEEPGFMESEPGDAETFEVLQRDIRSAVDISSAAKSFSLSLHQFGPYSFDYTRNGRHLLLGGRKGHVACFDWTTKRLLCEINVMEEVSDVSFLHQETIFAVAQKDWVYMYDNQGIELHCVRQLNRVLRMEFLPYHFLLSTSSDRGFLSWLDVSIGKMVTQTKTNLGRLNVMCQNPYNATIALGTAKGTVTMWSPNVKEPLATILCHYRPVKAVAIDRNGTYMATSATDGSLKIWDVRNFKCFQSYRLKSGARNLAFSQRGLLAASTGHVVQIYRDVCTKEITEPYLLQNVGRSIRNTMFCPYEDVLGVGHDGGFTSLLIPGAGEPNFDALESNPFQTKSQRREWEVKALLEKIQPEMICLDPSNVNKIKPGTEPSQPSTSFTVKRASVSDKLKKKGKMSGGKIVKTKNTIRDAENRKLLRNKIAKVKKTTDEDERPSSVNEDKPYNALDRFKAQLKKSS